MVGHRIGGVNVFGGGLALYNAAHVLIGAVGVSGDSSCADHNIAWRTRNTLNLDHVPGGVSGDTARPDNIIYDITPAAGEQEGMSAGGFGHPQCSVAATAVAASLPHTRP
jgi:Haem-degrading